MTTDDDSTEPTDPQPQPDPHPHPRSRDFTHIYGTRIRTSTAGMLAAFLGLLVLLGYTTDHYAQIDADNAARELARRPALTQTTDDYTPTRTTSSSRRSSTPRSSSTDVTTTSGDSETESSSTEPSASNNQLPLPSWLFPQGSTPSTRQQTTESQVPQR